MMTLSLRSGVSYLSRALMKKDGSVKLGPNADSELLVYLGGRVIEESYFPQIGGHL
jgi:hypothetical protein